MSGVAEVLGVNTPTSGDDVDLDLAWEKFVKRVWSWSDTPAPDPLPEVGDGAVFTQFLKNGVWRAMGGEASMEQLMVHEFGHALQLEQETMRARMSYWGHVSGFTNSKRGEPSDGFVGGSNRMEQMKVLIRLLLSNEPNKMPRGGLAEYQVSDQANFVNRYARYDLREDYAESFRLMTYDPERLIKVAPEKFLYLNALGWNARLDRENPGPLWYSGNDLDRLFPRAMRSEVFRKIFGMEGAGPAWHPVPLAAVLRAHQDELSSADLPPPYLVAAIPNDLPKELQTILSPGLLSVEIDGKTYVASEQRQKLRQDEAVVEWMNTYSYNFMIEKFRLQGTDGILGSYQKVVADENDPAKRSQHFEIIRELGRDLVDDGQWDKWYLAETQFHKEAGNVWLAARYSMLASDGTPEERLAQIRDLGSKADAGFERACFLATAVDVALETGDPKKVASAIESIPGETFGAWLRLRAGMRSAKALGGEIGKDLLEVAGKEAEGVKAPLIREHLEGLLK